MAQLIKTANTKDNNKCLDDFSLIPEGKYLAMIIDSERVATKKNDGYFILLTFKIVDGDFKGRIIRIRLNTENPNPLAVEIADKTLNTICKACGKFGVKDSQELHGILLHITVYITKPKDGYGPQNDIKFYEHIDEGEKMEMERADPSIAFTEKEKKKSGIPSWAEKKNNV
jgi:hypothetical protein